jgi:hypothetical protein
MNEGKGEVLWQELVASSRKLLRALVLGGETQGSRPGRHNVGQHTIKSTLLNVRQFSG